MPKTLKVKSKRLTIEASRLREILVEQTLEQRGRVVYADIDDIMAAIEKAAGSVTQYTEVDEKPPSMGPYR